jgi:hypothetical protein
MKKVAACKLQIFYNFGKFIRKAGETRKEFVTEVVFTVFGATLSCNHPHVTPAYHV